MDWTEHRYNSNSYFDSDEQECIAIMLLCLDHGHSEKANLHGYSYEVWKPLWQHHTESLPRSLIRDPLYCNKRPCIVLLLTGVASHNLSPP